MTHGPAPPPAAVPDGRQSSERGRRPFCVCFLWDGWWPLGRKSERFLLLFPAGFLSFTLSVGRGYGSQEEEAAEAVVLISFVGLKARPSGVAAPVSRD